MYGDRQEPQTIVKTYSVIIYVMACFMLMVVILDPYAYASVKEKVPTEYSYLVDMVMRLDQTISGLISLFCLIVGILRSQRSPLARRATTILSYSFLIAPPLIGLAPFFYWILRVQKQEQL
jgi:hypothetical protein